MKYSLRRQQPAAWRTAVGLPPTYGFMARVVDFEYDHNEHIITCIENQLRILVNRLERQKEYDRRFGVPEEVTVAPMENTYFELVRLGRTYRYFSEPW